MKFIQTLWSGRRRQPNWRLQERVSAYTLYPRHRNVVAAPVKCPVKDDKRA